MKKFLFTLAALLMAGSLFARDYLYIDNFEVKKDELGTTKVIPVKAHFDRYVSAWEIWLTMPEGVTVTAWEEGEDTCDLPYTNQNGKSKTLDASITTKDNAHFIAITDALQGDFIQNEEGAWISAGPVHWKPGDYDEMILLTVSIDENFKGGVISVKSAPACGNDLRPEVQQNKADGTVETEECTVTVEKSAAPQPTLTWNDVTYTMTASCDGHQVVLMINNEAVENPYTVAQTDKDQTIEFSAYTIANADESGKSETIKQTVIVPAKVVEQTDKPVITPEDVEGGVKVTATGKGTVKMYVDGVEVQNPYIIAQTDEEKTYEVTATAQEEGKTISETVTLKVTVPAKPAPAPEPTFNWDPDTYTMEAVCQGHTVVLMANGAQVSNPYTVAQTTEDQTIEFSAYTVANADESGNSETIKQTVTVPAKPAEPGETKTFVKVTSMDQIKDGQKYIFVYEAAPVAMADMAGASAAVTLANGEVTADMNKVMPFVLGKSGSYYTFTNGDNQLGAVQTGGSGSSATWGPTAGGYNVTWIITNVNGAVDGYTVRNFEKERYMKVATYDNTFILSTSSTAPYALLYVEKTDEPVLPDLTGEITIGDPDANGGVAVAYKGDEDVTLSVKVKDAQGNEVDDFTFVDGVVTLPDYGTYTVEVVASADGYKDLTADKVVTWTKPEDPALGGYFVWGALDANGQFTVVYNNYDLEEQGVTFTLVVTDEDGNTIEPTDGYYQAAEGTHTYTATVTATGYKAKTDTHEYTYTKPNPAPVPTFNWNPDTYTMEAVCEGHTVVLMANGTEVTNPKTYTQTTEEQKINFSAYTVANDGETANSATVYYAQNPVIIPALVLEQTAKPEIVVTNDDNFYYVTVEAVEGVATLYNAEGEAYTAEELPVKLERTDETYRVLFKADAIADGKTVSEQVTEMVSVAPKVVLKQLTGKITFSVTEGNINDPKAGIVTATYDGNETDVTVKIVGYTAKVAAATSEGVRLPDYGTYQVKAVATAEGYADLEEEGEVTWDEPQTAAPAFNVSEISEDGLTVTATATEGTVTLYVVDEDGNATAIENPTTFKQKDEAYTVNLKAVAHVDGAKDGVATTKIDIPAKSSEPGTGVNELVDGKAVKSVRYFNMAGQEMQEVNGVTIVVTTYTDGTTSAVKVMK